MYNKLTFVYLHYLFKGEILCSCFHILMCHMKRNTCSNVHTYISSNCQLLQLLFKAQSALIGPLACSVVIGQPFKERVGNVDLCTHLRLRSHICEGAQPLPPIWVQSLQARSHHLCPVVRKIAAWLWIEFNFGELWPAIFTLHSYVWQWPYLALLGGWGGGGGGWCHTVC